MALTEFRQFLVNLKSLGTSSALSEAETLIRNVNSGIQNVDIAIGALRVSASPERLILLGGQSVGSVHTILRQANLRALLALSDANVAFTSADEAAFKVTVGPTPERGIYELTEASTLNKQRFPNMNVAADETALLSTTGKNNVAKAESNLLKHFALGTKIAITIGVVTVGVGWAIKDTQDNEGCFMCTTINNRTTSCKIQKYSCGKYGNQGMFCSQVPPLYNVTIILMTLANRPNDDTHKISVCEAAGIQPSEMSNKLTTIIDSKFPEVSAVIKKIAGDIPTSPCTITHPQIDNGVVPACRMCSPTASPTSTEFIDPQQYGDNITFVCRSNPSILDTITDVALSTGKNLFDGIGSGLSSLLRPIGIAAAVIVFVVVIVAVIMALLPKKKSAIMASDDSASVQLSRNPSSGTLTSTILSY